MRGLFLGVLSVGCATVGCAGESASADAVHCAGVLTDSRIGYEYSADGTGATHGRVSTDNADAEAFGADGRVIVALDWQGAANGGEFEFFRDGSTLFVDYRDPDGNRYWSVPGCFP